MATTITQVQLILTMPPAGLRFVAPDTIPDPGADDGRPIARLTGWRDGAAFELLGAPAPRFATWGIALQRPAAQVAENVAIGGMAISALCADWPARLAWYMLQVARSMRAPAGFTVDMDDHRLRMVFDPARALLLLHVVCGDV